LDSALVIALIALVGSIVSTVATVFGTPAVQARSAAGKVLQQHREPLLGAAFDLQARLYNILRLQFVEKWIADPGPGRRTQAIDSTLYVFAQFFAWMEIIRREIHVLRFSRDGKTREIAHVIDRIEETFLADSYGSQFMLWRIEQRGIGERMIQRDGNALGCLGYASFLTQRSSMQEWLAPLEGALLELGDGGRRRLTDLQHLLVELVRRLDLEHTERQMDTA
jgi:hypothetical protein